MLDIDKQPVFQPIASSNLTADLVARVKDAIERFPSTEAAVDWRARLDAANRQRPALEFALEQAGIAGELKGTCPDCPP